MWTLQTTKESKHVDIANDLIEVVLAALEEDVEILGKSTLRRLVNESVQSETGKVTIRERAATGHLDPATLTAVAAAVTASVAVLNLALRANFGTVLALANAAGDVGWLALAQR